MQSTIYDIDFNEITEMTVKEDDEVKNYGPYGSGKKENKPLNSKFRVWINDAKKLYDVEVINFLTNMIQVSDERGIEYLYSLDNCILEQYSNTFDKNKKKICEGDIVLVPLIIEKDCGWNERQKEHVKYKVVFDKDGYFKLQEFDECGSIIMANYMEDEIEIIGNIYENEV